MGIFKGDAMDSKAKRAEISTRATTSREFRHAVRYRGVTLVEVYSKTWGPCSCIFPKLQQLYAEYTERPIKIVMAQCDDIDELEEYVGGSKPIFLLYQKSARLEVIEGVSFVQITRAVAEHAPGKDDLQRTKDDP